jgi:hypothetical protein
LLSVQYSSHGEEALVCQRAVAGGSARGTACTDSVAIVRLTGVAAFGEGRKPGTLKTGKPETFTVPDFVPGFRLRCSVSGVKYTDDARRKGINSQKACRRDHRWFVGGYRD